MSRAQIVAEELNLLGVESIDLDELVHEACASRAADINNEGLARQVAFLLDECSMSPGQLWSALMVAANDDAAELLFN